MAENFTQQLEQVRQECLKCEKCSLCKTRTNTVFSAGVPNDKLMLIGEAPGYYEDMKGEPFVGKPVSFWTKYLNVSGFQERKIFTFAIP